MTKLFTLAFTLTLLCSIASAQSLSGIRVGDSPTVLEKLNLQALAREGRGPIKTVKYRRANGNELSVTFNTSANRISYIEADWNPSLKPEGAASDIPAFKFGVTTLEDIRRVNGSNGFSWRSRAMMDTDTEIISFNAYEIEGKPNQVAVFVTSLSIPAILSKHTADKDKPNRSEMAKMAKFFKLQAIILADKDYLDVIWGEEKFYDKDSKPISWDK